MTDQQPDTVTHQQSVDFGTRLKYIREYNGLSQRELAKRAGVPHSSISMIEQGTNSPSINSLAKILGGIPMSIAQFFSCDLSLLSQQVFRASDLRDSQRSVSAGINAQNIPFQDTETQTRFARLTYGVNADTGDVPQYSTQAISGYILSGSLELTLNAEVVTLSSGDAFSLGVKQPFRFRNPSQSEECVLLTCTL